VPRYDLEDQDLVHYRTRVPAPADLAEFWQRTIAEARALSWEPKLEAVHCGLRVIDVFDVTFSGFGGEPIKAWLHRPTRAPGDLPIVVRYTGYECGRGLPHQVNQWPLAGYASLTVDARGQGSGWGWVGSTPDSGAFGPCGPGLLSHGILDPETYYFRRLFTDSVLAVDAARQLRGVDPDAVAATGTSQGGGITLAVAGLVDGLRAIMPDVPFLCDIPRGMALSDHGPYLELVRYLATHRQDEDRVMEVLAYFDAAILARTASAPALFSVALMDHWCPPSTVYAAFNAYPGDKEIRRYPYNDHEGGQWHHEAEQLRWLPGVVAPPSL
jgi:cephalosporin-C deacetylase